MKARRKISLSSASVWTSARRRSGASSRTRVAPRARPLTTTGRPERRSTSPLNSPAWCTVTRWSAPDRIAISPSTTTNSGRFRSPSSQSLSPSAKSRSRAKAAMRAICSGVSFGKISSWPGSDGSPESETGGRASSAAMAAPAIALSTPPRCRRDSSRATSRPAPRSRSPDARSSSRARSRAGSATSRSIACRRRSGRCAGAPTPRPILTQSSHSRRAACLTLATSRMWVHAPSRFKVPPSGRPWSRAFRPTVLEIQVYSCT